MNCCDTCPMQPTCEEISDFLDQNGIPADSPLRDYPDDLCLACGRGQLRQRDSDDDDYDDDRDDDYLADLIPEDWSGEAMT